MKSLGLYMCVFLLMCLAQQPSVAQTTCGPGNHTVPATSKGLLDSMRRVEFAGDAANINLLYAAHNPFGQPVLPELADQYEYGYYCIPVGSFPSGKKTAEFLAIASRAHKERMAKLRGVPSAVPPVIVAAVPTPTPTATPIIVIEKPVNPSGIIIPTLPLKMVAFVGQRFTLPYKLVYGNTMESGRAKASVFTASMFSTDSAREILQVTEAEGEVIGLPLKPGEVLLKLETLNGEHATAVAIQVIPVGGLLTERMPVITTRMLIILLLLLTGILLLIFPPVSSRLKSMHKRYPINWRLWRYLYVSKRHGP